MFEPMEASIHIIIDGDDTTIRFRYRSQALRWLREHHKEHEYIKVMFGPMVNEKGEKQNENMA